VYRSCAEMTTTFENVYTSQGRRQMIHGVAATLTAEAIPAHWHPAIVHLGPVARECDPALVDAFGDAFVGVTPQGWMRRWDQGGHVTRGPWDEAEAVLSRADAVVLSEEDVEGDEDLVTHYAARTRLLVLTRGAAGCTVYAAGQARSFPAPVVRAVDATGAGDIFAAAFFVRLERSGDPWAAARLANCVAARSVPRPGLAGTPSVEGVARCEARLVQG
jgi:sugar/nucleoside kinase (ribokinase family)